MPRRHGRASRAARSSTGRRGAAEAVIPTCRPAARWRPMTPADGTWTSQRERSNLWALALMRRIAIGLGRPVARLLLGPIALYFLLFSGAPSRASAQYLRRVLGRAPTFGERLRHLHAFASTVLDRVYLLQERFDGFDIRIVGTEHLD